MKEAFSEYYRPTAEEFKSLWKKARVVLDANVLLSLYGYSEATRLELLKLFSDIKERLWIPHQFGLEYQRNRVKAIADQIQSYKHIKKELKRVLDESLRPTHRHPFVKDESMKALEQICKELDDGRHSYQELLGSDTVCDSLTGILEGHVGERPTDERLQEMHEEARKRYDDSTPPGYMDKGGKPAPDLFGDYIGWRQILEFGRGLEVPLILVTDDRKEDWWRIQRIAGESKARTIGPRPELINEYRSTCEQPFYMYSLRAVCRPCPGNPGSRRRRDCD